MGYTVKRWKVVAAPLVVRGQKANTKGALMSLHHGLVECSAASPLISICAQSTTKCRGRCRLRGTAGHKLHVRKRDESAKT